MTDGPTELAAGGWPVVALGDVLEDVRSGFSHRPVEDGVAHLRPMNVDRAGRLFLDELKHVPAVAAEDHADVELRDGDVLFNNTNSPELVGKTALVSGVGRQRWAFSNHMTRLRPVDDLNAQFLALVLHAWWQSGELQRRSRSYASQASVPLSVLLGLPIPMPPADEQRELAAQLVRLRDGATRTAATMAAIGQRLTALRQVVVDGAVAGAAAADARPLDALRLPDRPIVYGILTPGPNVLGGRPYVKVRDYSQGRVPGLDDLLRTSEDMAGRYRRSELQADDVLVSIRGTVGRVMVVPPELEGANITQDSARISLDPSLVLPCFGALALRSSELQHRLLELRSGVAVQGVNLRDLRKVAIPTPELGAQRRAVATAEAELARIDGLAARVASAADALSSAWVMAQRRLLNIPDLLAIGELQPGPRRRKQRTPARRKRRAGGAVALAELLSVRASMSASELHAASRLDIGDFYLQLRELRDEGRLEADAATNELRLVEPSRT